jgi:hypothetical protein
MNTSKEEFKQRMNTCYSCPEYRQVTKQCKKCNCFLFLKAFLKNSECPLGKWNETEDNKSST